MAAFHYHPHRTAAELEVDAAVARAEDRCDVLEARVDELERHIVAARDEAVAAGIFDTRIVPPKTAVAAPRSRRPFRVVARTALPRAGLR